jgi:hypothetical protein
MLSFEFIYEVVDEAVVEILTSQVGVTGGGLDLEDTLLNGQEGDIEGSSSEIEDEHVPLTLDFLVETVGDGGRGGLVDDSEHVQAGDQTGVLGGLTLRVVEIGGDGHDGIVDGSTQVCLGRLAHLDQDHGGDLLGGELLLLALELDLHDGLSGAVDDLEREVLHIRLDLGVGELAADEALGIEDGVGGVHGDLVLGGITDQALGVGEGDEGRGGAVPLVVGDDLDAVIAEDTHAGVGGPQIDSYRAVRPGSCGGGGRWRGGPTNGGSHDVCMGFKTAEDRSDSGWDAEVGMMGEGVIEGEGLRLS